MVRLAPDAWASRTLLLHIDRRHHHNAGAIVSRMVLKVQTQDYRATTKQTSFSLVHAPFSIPLRTFPPYTRVAPNTAEVSRGTVVLGQGFLRTVRRVDEWGETRETQSSTTTPVTRDGTFLFLPLSIAFFLLFKYIPLQQSASFTISIARLSLSNNDKADPTARTS